jgi:hypothetical protein
MSRLGVPTVIVSVENLPLGLTTVVPILAGLVDYSRDLLT